MPEPASTSTAVPQEDFCVTFNVPMVKIQEHTGDGNAKWSEPLCPRIHTYGGEGCVCKGEVADAKEPVKSDAGTVAAKAPAPSQNTSAAAPAEQAKPT